MALKPSVLVDAAGDGGHLGHVVPDAGPGTVWHRVAASGNVWHPVAIVGNPQASHMDGLANNGGALQWEAERFDWDLP